MGTCVNKWIVLVAAFSIFIGCTADSDKREETVNERARLFLDDYQAEYDRLWSDWTSTEWEAATTGKTEAFEAHARAELALKKFHSDSGSYQEIQELLDEKDMVDPLDLRAIQVAELQFKGNQLPPDLLEMMATMSAKIGQTFNTFRGELDGKKYSNNDLLTMLAKERSTPGRRAIWEALKQVGGAVGPGLVALAKVRNEGAEKLGYDNYWDMKVRLQELDPGELMDIFEELEELTSEPFQKMKVKLDGELARKFGIESAELGPWHYNDPFFQSAPPAEDVDLDEFYRSKTKEKIAELAVRFYEDIGLPVNDIMERSDLYEREGKDQHAFCEDMDRKGDVRILVNLRPTAEWMDTLLHENGHAVYDKYLDPSLPFNLRQSSHTLTTEGVAMLFGALAKNPSWLVAYAGADEERVREVREAILEQRRREQLIFCRWTLVMLHFEKELYEDPSQDLNRLWWDFVERFQFLKRPEDRDEPDWASKPHFTIAPVYYHNYQLGELFAAQLRSTLARLAKHEGPTNTLSFNGRKDFGEFLREKVFKPGKRMEWSLFVKQATGEPLTAKHFAEEL